MSLCLVVMDDDDSRGDEGEGNECEVSDWVVDKKPYCDEDEGGKTYLYDESITTSDMREWWLTYKNPECVEEEEWFKNMLMECQVISDASCPVCFEHIKLPHIQLLECGHMTCESCYVLLPEPKCPVCRKRIA